MLAAGSSKDHRAQTSVADGERLALPVFGGLVIPEIQPLGAGGRGEEERGDKCSSNRCHDLLYCASLLETKMRVDGGISADPSPCAKRHNEIVNISPQT